MFKIDRRQPWPPHIDLATVRETLKYIEQDVGRIPQLKKVAEALQETIREIERAEVQSRVPGYDNVITHSQFLPKRKH